MGRHRLVVIALLATGCRQVLGFQEAVTQPADATADTAGDTLVPDAPPDVNVNAWTKRKKLAVNNQQVAGALENFPVLVRLTADADLAAFARPDGADLLFTAADGTTKLAHEIERYTTSGELIAWVKLPDLSSAAPTDFYLYFGNPVAGDQQTRAAVWDADYVGVWHLAETTGTALADSTAAARTGTKFAADKPGPGPAAIGGGQVFSADDNGISIGNDAALDIENVTIEMWIKPGDCTGGVVKRLIDFTLAFDFSWAIGYPCGDVNGLNHNSIVLDLPNDHLQTQANSLVFNTTHHLVFTSNPSRVYLDGTQRATATTAITLAQDNINTIIGNREATQPRALIGELDEVRISKVARSQAYVATSFANQKNFTTFITVGAVEDQ